jgi:peptide/nickel transport system ATP-binding protein
VPVEKRGQDTISDLQMVFQNPFDTLNPSHTVGSQIARVIRKFGGEREEEKVQERVMQLLDIVKLPRDFAKRRPRQLSGGQKQRVGIARAFAGKPAVVIADEPVSALDVSIRAQVLDLFAELNDRLGVAYLFITHDLTVARAITDEVMVMHEGRIVETGRTAEVLSHPQSEAARALVDAAPDLHRAIAKRMQEQG